MALLSDIFEIGWSYCFLFVENVKISHTNLNNENKQMYLGEASKIPYIFDIWQKQLVKRPNEVFLVDVANNIKFTLKPSDEISGKVYAFLKYKRISKEDFVLINLPRGASIILALLGVWKAGAAFVITEDTLAPERIEYIRKDCSCKLTIDNDIWEEIKDGSIGELCFAVPFTRGYINLPEQTAKSFIDGIYHTGDLAHRLPDGNYVLDGRSNDMIKINGNRIEPAEIEAAFRKITGVTWCAAKGISEVRRSYVCLYYKENIDFDEEAINKKMQNQLPSYMIPAYYMKIKDIPLKASGKMDRNALPAPEIQDFKNEYIEPRDELEKLLCEAFAKALNTKAETISIKDDFYKLGGDSVATMLVVVNLDNLDVSAKDVFRCKTVEKLADLIRLRKQNQAEPLEEVKRQVNEGIQNCDYDYFTEYEQVFANDCMEINYVGNIDFQSANQRLTCDFISLDTNHDANARLGIDLWSGDNGEISVTASYVAKIYKKENIDRFMRLYIDSFEELIKEER